MSEPAKSKIEASRWHRPKSYLTVVAIVLLAALTSAIIIFSDYNYSFYKALERPQQGVSFDGVISFLISVWTLIATALMITTIAARWLLMGKKKGVYVSLAALIQMVFMLPFLISLHYTSLGYYEGWMYEYAFSFYFSIAVIVAAFPLLILGWKRMQWN